MFSKSGSTSTRFVVLESCAFLLLGWFVRPASAEILIASSNDNRIKRYDLTNQSYTGNFADLSLLENFGLPYGLTIGAQEDVIVSDRLNVGPRVRRFNMYTGAPMGSLFNNPSNQQDIEYNPHDGAVYFKTAFDAFVTRYPTYSLNPHTSVLACPSSGIWDVALEIGPDGDLYTACYSSSATGFPQSIYRTDLDSFTLLGQFATGATLIRPRDLKFGPDGNLYVSDSGSNSVLRFNGTTGAFMDVFASGIPSAFGLAFGSDGSLYVASNTGNYISRRDGTTGAEIGTFSGNGLTNPTHLLIIPEPTTALFLLLGAAALCKVRKPR